LRQNDSAVFENYMTATTLFYGIIAILTANFALERVLAYLNFSWYKKPIPAGLEDVYDDAAYTKSQEYKSANYRFSLLSSTLSFVLLLSFLSLGGFAVVDTFARSFTTHEIAVALLFFGSIGAAASLLDLPFDYYGTFVIEERFGFNKTTLKTYMLDKVKGLFVSVILGGGLLAVIMLCYRWAGTHFWWYVWILIIGISLLLNLFYARLIVPLFNKQTPLETGSLKDAIASYAAQVGFTIDHIFVIDGSKRSTKANAYFSGFGSQKRITLYDTLITELTEDEIVAVLAHEVGHYKKHHIIYNLVLSTFTTGFTLWLFSLVVDSSILSQALGVAQPSFHIGLVAFGFLFAPISTVTGLVMSLLSRKHEYEADHYAAQTYRKEPLIAGLKKLSRTSLSNLTPHPAYVFVNYSHPSLQQRIKAMQQPSNKPTSDTNHEKRAE
jgi:STE24 endopeptidase